MLIKSAAFVCSVVCGDVVALDDDNDDDDDTPDVE